MDLNRFLHERRHRWERLSSLLDTVDSQGMENLSPEQGDELFGLYRVVSSDLNIVQTRSGNPALLEYLEGLVGRAYANLSVPRRVRPLAAWWRILRHRFPAVIRGEKRLVGMAAATLLSGAAFGFVLTLLEPETARVFVPPEHLMESPSERVARLEEGEELGESQVDSAGQHAVFTTFLFTHNIRITVLAFALGFTFGVGTILLLFYNGVLLGSIAALYLADGVFTFFVAWVGPHGSIELPSVVFGSTAGLMLARTQLRRNEGTVYQQLRRIRPVLVNVIVGTASLLVIAGFIEGGFSQINEPTIPYALKIAVAVLLFVGLLAYLFWMPVKKDEGLGEMTDEVRG